MARHDDAAAVVCREKTSVLELVSFALVAGVEDEMLLLEERPDRLSKIEQVERKKRLSVADVVVEGEN